MSFLNLPTLAAAAMEEEEEEKEDVNKGSSNSSGASRVLGRGAGRTNAKKGTTRSSRERQARECYTDIGMTALPPAEDAVPGAPHE